MTKDLNMKLDVLDMSAVSEEIFKSFCLGFTKHTLIFLYAKFKQIPVFASAAFHPHKTAINALVCSQADTAGDESQAAAAVALCFSLIARVSVIFFSRFCFLLWPFLFALFPPLWSSSSQLFHRLSVFCAHFPICFNQVCHPNQDPVTCSSWSAGSWARRCLPSPIQFQRCWQPLPSNNRNLPPQRPHPVLRLPRDCPCTYNIYRPFYACLTAVQSLLPSK